MTNTFADSAKFFRAWLSNPLQVASIIPSSSVLAEAITAEISPASAPVIELGAGTGVFTRAIIKRGVDEEQLALVESGAEFASMLQSRFPAATTLSMDATRLRHIDLFGGKPAGAVVSGLPLLSIPPRKTFAILDSAFRHLRPDGAFYQFTYGPRCPAPRVLLDRLRLEATRIGGVWANFPPAAVYRFRRR